MWAPATTVCSSTTQMFLLINKAALWNLVADFQRQYFIWVLVAISVGNIHSDFSFVHVLKDLSQKLKVRRLDSTEASWLRFRRKLSSTLQKAFGNECVCHESQLAASIFGPYTFMLFCFCSL